MTSGVTLTSSPTTLSGTYSYIYGPAAAAYTVTSLGTVASNGTGFSTGVYLKGGGSLTNGSNATLTASITGFGTGAGVDMTTRAGTVTNYGVIAGGATGKGVELDGGGSVFNGNATDTTASILGHGSSTAVLISGSSAGTVVNFGTIGGPDSKSGVSFGVNSGGGTVINGSPGDTTAFITDGTLAGSGVAFQNAAARDTIINYGTISGTASDGVYWVGGGIISNAGTSALIIATKEHNSVYAKQAVTISNLGTISNAGTSHGDIYLVVGGTVTNGSETVRTALISGTTVTVLKAHGTAGLDLANFATIMSTGTGGNAVYSFGGTITNGSVTDTAAVIHGGAVNDGIQINGTLADTITNFGTISGGDGIFLTGTSAPATLVNAGAIIGTGTSPASGYALLFGTGGDLVVVDPGARFVGTVRAGGGSVLELAAGAGVGTLNSLGGSYQGFSTVNVDAGADWDLANASTLSAGVTLAVAGTVSVTGGLSGSGMVALNGGVASLGTAASTGLGINLTGTAADTLILTGGSGGTLSNAVIGFGLGDRIEVAGLTFDNAVLSGGTLHITSGGTTVFNLTSVSFDGVTNPVFGVSTDTATGNTALSITACFAAGTRIRTEHGETPVEALREGDKVHARISNALLPIIWLGYRQVDCRRHPQPRQVWPIRIRAGAFGAGSPGRDLWLSPDHAVYLADALIPIKLLVNGATIEQVPVDAVTYYHVELARHDVVLAEGLPCESFLDTGNRCNFDNGGGAVALHPDFASLTWEAEGCAPLLIAGPELEAARHRVNARTVPGTPRIRVAAA